MPRASWRGFVRLSLVSCPIYLSPATTARNPFACTRCGNQRRSIWTRTTCRIGV